ncbi:hypothetical protein LR48_Vigan02g043700 [Vigna angularis]|uniref:Uncharacterized protein n=1 Tax=Phaseolus angularis TaxID=3914 RepID=A0A0L9TV48_PHAAN|nr:hypothetical protein LR48_Vigan02g043700 [Vigna angularis]
MWWGLPVMSGVVGNGFTGRQLLKGCGKQLRESRELVLESKEVRDFPHVWHHSTGCKRGRYKGMLGSEMRKETLAARTVQGVFSSVIPVQEWNLENFLQHHSAWFDGKCSTDEDDHGFRDIEKIYSSKRCPDEKELAYTEYLPYSVRFPPLTAVPLHLHITHPSFQSVPKA